MKSFLLSLLFILTLHAFSQNSAKQAWIDSVYQQLTINERFAQLLMVRANQSKEPYYKEINGYIKDYNLGGVCFFANDPHAQLKQTQQWQNQAKTPLMIGIDAEWGLGMRLDSTMIFPFQLTLGSIVNDSMIYDMGLQIGQECKRMGIHLNFAPVVDINNNLNNPVINSRSFGDDPNNVSRKAALYMKGLQDAGIIATAKHFPGHGDTDSDSHLDLPVIAHSKARLDSVELAPFKYLISENIKGIMVAHLYIPALEHEANVASTLSPAIITGLLHKELGFKGLIVTDALDMKGVTKYFPAGEIEVRAMLAGNDILLLPENVPAAINGLVKAYESGRISPELLEIKCKKILGYKYDLGLTKKPVLNPAQLIADLNSPKSKALKEKLFENSITLITNDSLLPLPLLAKKQLAIVNLGWTKENSFDIYSKKYTEASYFYVPNKLQKQDIDSIAKKLQSYDIVIFNLGKTNIFPQKSFGVQQSHVQLIDLVNKNKKCVVNFFGSPLAIPKFFPNLKSYEAFILSHQDNLLTQKLPAEMIFGALPFLGKLPVSLSPEFKAGHGLTVPLRQVIRFGSAENEGIDGEKLEKKIDQIVELGIKKKAFPGCQITVARHGSIVFQKAYGYQTYDSLIPITEESIYDVASLTKVCASVPMLMVLVDEKKIHPDSAISSYLPYLHQSNKKKLTLRNIYTHQAQLKSWIPFYLKSIDEKGNLDTNVFRHERSDVFSLRVAEGLYIREDYRHKMFDSIAMSELRKKKEYQYSDLGFYWVPQIVENQLNEGFDKALISRFYEPLNMIHTRFLPRNYFDISQIVPTEKDTIFRKQLIHGDVHDQGAAMLGGISGHAGLFSNSEDLAILFQMYLQKGFYGGNQLVDSKTVAEFTRYQFDGNTNRRGIGFDKPLKTYSSNGPVCPGASTKSFGHSGFTGTYIWADPTEELIFVFLSNRVYPTSNNALLSKLNIRTTIHQEIYNALITRDKH